MKIVLIGSQEAAAMALDELLRMKADVALVISNERTQDAQVNRFRLLEVAKAKQIRCIETGRKHMGEGWSAITEQSFDLLLSVYNRFLVPTHVLGYFSERAINFHPSLLPY